MEWNTRTGCKLQSDRARCSNSVLRNFSGAGDKQHNKLHKNNHNRFRNYLHLCVYAVIAFTALPARAEPTANQTAVASPTAVSSGSAVNQAVQVVNSQYFQQQYGAGVQCQGTTLVVAPFVIQGLQAPAFETNSDWGVSMQVSMPLDRTAVRQCRERAAIEIVRQQAEADKAQLDYQLVRALKCTELIQAGAFLHPSSPYAGLCADVLAMGSDGYVRNGIGQVVYAPVSQREDKPSPSLQEASSQSSSPEASGASEPAQTGV